MIYRDFIFFFEKAIAENESKPVCCWMSCK